MELKMILYRNVRVGDMHGKQGVEFATMNDM